MRRLLVLVPLLFLVHVGVAGAVTVNVTGGKLVVAAGSDEDNAVSVEPSAGGYLVRDQGVAHGTATHLVPSTSTATCSTSGADGIECPSGSPGPDVTSIAITLGNENDSATIDPAISLPASMDGGDGDDDLTAGGGPATLDGGTGAGSDTLNGGEEADTLKGGDGVDFLTGNGGADKIFGGEGGDTISGLAGDDAIDGGPGADNIFGGDDNDQISGGSGTDDIAADAGNDTVNVADDVSDTVDCGDDTDQAITDTHDTAITNCEQQVAGGFNTSVYASPSGSETGVACSSVDPCSLARAVLLAKTSSARVLVLPGHFYPHSSGVAPMRLDVTGLRVVGAAGRANKPVIDAELYSDGAVELRDLNLESLTVGVEAGQPQPTTGYVAIDGVICAIGRLDRIAGQYWVTNSLFLNHLFVGHADPASPPPHFTHDTFLKGPLFNEALVNATGVGMNHSIYDGAFVSCCGITGADNFNVSPPASQPTSQTPGHVNRQDGTEYPDSRSIDYDQSPPLSPPPIPAPEPYDVYGHPRTLGDGTDAGAVEYVPVPPGATASGLGADSVTTSSARIVGTVDPRGAPTGVSEAFGSTGFGPSSDVGTVAMTAGPTVLAKTFSGLTAGTTYKFHLLMRNVNGHTTSADATFTTASTSTPATVSGNSTQATLALKCNLKNPCKGNVTLSLLGAGSRAVTRHVLRAGLTLAKTNYTIRSRTTKKLRLKFSRKARRALKHKRRVKALITLRERDARGHTHTTLHATTLRLSGH